MDPATSPIEARQKAYSYIRFSTPEQMKGDSLRRQTEAAAIYAAANNLDLDQTLTFEDLGKSAFRGANAQTGALSAFRRAVEDGVIATGSVLLVENLDRVTRQDPWDAMAVFKGILDAGVSIVTLQDRREYSRATMKENPMRIMESIITMIRANEESETKSRRLKATWINKRAVAQSRPLTSISPAWLTLKDGKFSIVEDRANVVRRIFSMSLEGVGQHKIAETFNRENIPTFGKAALWHRSYVSKILQNPAVIGTIVPHLMDYSDGRRVRKALEPVPNYFPAVIEVETFQRIQAMNVGSHAPLVRTTMKTPELQNILGGLARCPKCHSTMTRVTKGKDGGKPYLVCTKAKAGAGCEYHGVRLEAIELSLKTNASYLLRTIPSNNEQLEAEWRGVEAALSENSRAIRNLIDAIAKRGPSENLTRRLAEQERAQRELEALSATLEKKVAAASPSLIARSIDELETALAEPAPSITEANALLRQLVTGVVVDYEMGHLVMQWKHGAESTLVYAWPRSG